jgi:hypothetical protein
MRKINLAIVFILLLGAFAAQALDREDVLALLKAGAYDDVLVEAIKTTGSRPEFTARDIAFVDDEYRVDDELFYHCLLSKPMSTDIIFALAQIDYDEDYFLKLIAYVGIARELESADLFRLKDLYVDDDVREALIMAKPKNGSSTVESDRPKMVQLAMAISGDAFEAENGETIYFYILLDGEVVREVVDGNIDLIIGTRQINKFVYGSYVDSVESGSHTVAVAILSSNRKPSQGEINSNILFTRRIELRDGYNNINLQSRQITGTTSIELIER